MYRLLLITTLFVIFGVNIIAQSTEDSTAIKECILNYIEGYYNADVERMDKAVHPELAKRTIYTDQQGNDFLAGMGKSYLIHATRHNKNDRVRNPEAEFKADITIYDIHDKYAVAKAVTNKFTFFDYVHLGKYNSEWKIVNVLWGMLPPPEKN